MSMSTSTRLSSSSLRLLDPYPDPEPEPEPEPEADPDRDRDRDCECEDAETNDRAPVVSDDADALNNDDGVLPPSNCESDEDHDSAVEPLRYALNDGAEPGAELRDAPWPRRGRGDGVVVQAWAARRRALEGTGPGPVCWDRDGARDAPCAGGGGDGAVGLGEGPAREEGRPEGAVLWEGRRGGGEVRENRGCL
ncbi:hypothetical protein H0H92_007851 [Tricholoma furcatifolium]|nr:hypothetical protein H0H92_007851 [Tricholoma furcatifolium]